MAATKPTKLIDLFNAFSNPSGGLNLGNPFPTGNQTSTPATLNKAPLNLAPAKPAPKMAPTSPTLNSLMMGGSSILGNTPLPVGYANSTPAMINQPSIFGSDSRSLSQVASGAPAPRPVMAPSAVSTPPRVVAPVNPSGAPVGPAGATGAAPAGETPNIPKSWLKADGTFKTPEEIAADLGTILQNSSNGGDIGKIALGQFGGNNKTAEQLATEARRIGNTRNDISTGAVDPYKVASESGIAYTPAELSAIEKAYAGVYDPALDSAMSKVEAKQKSDATAAAAKADEDKTRLQAELDAKKPFTLGTNDRRFGADGKEIARGAAPASTSSGSGGSGPYVAGANPVVDAWAERIANGSAKITDIPASDKGLRNAVTVAMQSAGNQSDGKPTTTEIGKQTLDVAERLLTMFDNGQGISTVGLSRLFGGGFNAPGTNSSNFQNLFDTLSANKSLEGVKFLKGQGSVSDAERQLLKSAMSELNQNQSEPEFRNSLVAIINKLKGNSGAEGESGGAIAKGTDGASYGYPGYISDGTQWVLNE